MILQDFCYWVFLRFVPFNKVFDFVSLTDVVDQNGSNVDFFSLDLNALQC